jgi:tripartite-type tricarboxylate transporter receptor subunit TctC
MSHSPVSRRRALQVLGAGAALVAAPHVGAQGAWPNRPIRIIVGFPPGGLTDAYARLYGDQVSAALKVPVVVENKPGAGAMIAIDTMVKAPADGYTLLMTTSGTVWQNRVLYAKLPYNLDKDITPVAVFPSGPLVMGVTEKVTSRNIKEFVAEAKTKPMSMGTYAPGSYPHMVADQLNRTEGTKLTSVHYRGESPMWIDVASGLVQTAIGSYQAFATVQPRGVRALGVTGSYRCPKLPDVPTLTEQGMTSRLVTLEGGLPLVARAGTPERVLQALSKVAVDGANTERAAKLRESFAIPNKPKNLVETRRDWERDVPLWIKMAVELGVKLD